MTDIEQILDYNAHNGSGAIDPTMAAAVYEAVAPVVDTLQTPFPPDAPARKSLSMSAPRALHPA
ncbi:hypothetical protein ACFYO1_01870 [Nocardia sp. NPDC006044]|uniref:hypothetical protein n=1 Tax=Nocardia sp. NPDC006044 TaxID=3364306 RepID=UPI0036C5884D